MTPRPAAPPLCAISMSPTRTTRVRACNARAMSSWPVAPYSRRGYCDVRPARRLGNSNDQSAVTRVSLIRLGNHRNVAGEVSGITRRIRAHRNTTSLNLFVQDDVTKGDTRVFGGSRTMTSTAKKTRWRTRRQAAREVSHPRPLVAAMELTIDLEVRLTADDLPMAAIA